MSPKMLCINTSLGFDGIEMEERLHCIRSVGFDGFFTEWERGAPVADVARQAKKLGLFYQSIHAPFGEVDKVWEPGEPGESYLKLLMDCVQDCADADVPLAIIHAIIGFDKHSPSDRGVERFDRLCRFADERGVLLGFENTEGEEYLARVLKELAFHPACRFCWDTGHEMCYNHSRDMTALYGDRLAGVHLNDNLGITGDEITWLDDAHLMPFDGIADWQGIADRLRIHDFQGPWTFELTRLNKPGRHTHDMYAQWDYREFLEQAFIRAQSVAAL